MNHITGYLSTKLTNATLAAFDAVSKKERFFSGAHKSRRLDYVLGRKKENRSNIGSRQMFARRFYPLFEVPHSHCERAPEPTGWSKKRIAKVRQDAARYRKRKDAA